jgi:hypothetical protein
VTGVFRAMGFDGVKLAILAVSAQKNFNGSVNVDNDGFVFADLAGAVTQYAGGLPLTAAGALAIENAAPTQYDQGVGFTAAGRVAVE